MKKHLLLLAIASFTACQSLMAQGIAVNADGSSADGSAMLDVKSTTQGVLVPRMDSAQRSIIGTPATGLLVYQTDGVTPGFYFYNGSAWTSLSGGGGGGAAGGDLTGSYPNPTIAATSGAGGDVVSAINASSSVINAANVGTGSGSATKFLNGTGAFSTPSGGAFTLTTTGSSGMATYSGGTLNIPNFSNYTYASGDLEFSNANAPYLDTFSAATGNDVIGALRQSVWSIPSVNVGRGIASATNVLTGVTTAGQLGIGTWGQVTGSMIASHTITTTNLPTGATATTFLRGDNTWATPSGGSTGTNFSAAGMVSVSSGGTHTIAATDQLIYCLSGSCTVDLPTSSSGFTAGQAFYMVDADATSGLSVAVPAGSSETLYVPANVGNTSSYGTVTAGSVISTITGTNINSCTIVYLGSDNWLVLTYE